MNHCLFLYRDISFHLQAFLDIDWASCPNDCSSISGFCLYLGCNLIFWGSRKQRTVSHFNNDSEYRAMAHPTVEILWLQYILREHGLTHRPPSILWCDNIGAKYLNANPLFRAWTKNIEIDLHFVRDLVASKSFSIRFLSSEDQLADTLTKPLTTARFILLWDNFNVKDLPLRLRNFS